MGKRAASGHGIVVARVRADRPTWRKMLAPLAMAITLLAVAVIILTVRGSPGNPAALRPAGNRPTPGLGGKPPRPQRDQGPFPVVYPQVEGWHGGQVRPTAIYVGQGGSPYVTGLKWLSWTSAGARARGVLHRQRPGCTRPSYQCPYQRSGVLVQLSQPRTHHGRRYFARMRWTYTSGHVRYVIGWRVVRGYWRSQGRPGSHSVLA